MKKITQILLPLFLFIGLFSFVPIDTHAASELNIYLFWGNGCPHCEKEKKFFAEILPNYPSVKLSTYEVYYNHSNVELMQKTANELGISAGGVPFLIIGNKEYVGYAEGTTDKEVESRIKYCLENNCPDSVSAIVNPTNIVSQNTAKNENNSNKEKKIINLPIIGEIDALDFSLPLLTIFMGALDGFNPCAMWTLLFLISLLLGLKNRRRMWVLGTAFIIASALVYFLFMAAWLQLILFLGFIAWVRTAIGLLAVVGGGYNLRSYVKEKGGCKVTGNEKRQLVFAKMKAIAQQNSLWLALGGIILLAFAVNLVELVCSAGFPAVFTQVLSLSGLSTWQYYAYIILYIFFFMLDDMIIFAIAMFTLEIAGISTKYGKWSKLIGGILMLIIGLLLIFKPELLMFG
jgi:glutaredoxin